MNATRVTVCLLICLAASGCRTKQTTFLKACHDGDSATILKLLPEISVDTQGPAGVTGLMLAAHAGHTDIVDQLLSQHARPEQVDKNGKSALDYALSEGHTDIAEHLLSAILRSPVETARTNALLTLAGQGYDGMVRTALMHGVDANCRDERGWTPLLCASWKGHYEVCRVLLSAGADPNAPETGPDPTYPIIVAAVGGHENIVELLVRHGASMSVHDGKGASALLRAVRQKRTRVVEKLLSLGCDPNEAFDGVPVLFMAVEMGEMESARLLIQHGARPEMRLDGKIVPLSMYLQQKHITNSFSSAAASTAP